MATNREKYGSTPIVLRTKVTYIASIINCPWARLMIPITPMIRVIPIPIRAYSPPLRTPATRVCRKTSIPSPWCVRRMPPPGGGHEAFRPAASNWNPSGRSYLRLSQGGVG